MHTTGKIGNNKYQFEVTKVSSGNLDVKEDVSDIIVDVMPSVVSITEKKISTVYDYWFGFGSGQQQESTGSGSGILIEEDDDNYYIATNNHVIDGADKIEVTFIDNTEKVVNKKQFEFLMGIKDNRKQIFTYKFL